MLILALALSFSALAAPPHDASTGATLGGPRAAPCGPSGSLCSGSPTPTAWANPIAAATCGDNRNGHFSSSLSGTL